MEKDTMALSNPAVPRKLLHRRNISVEGYQREDGLFDIEGHLVDVKGYEFHVSGGSKPAGEPIHDMWLRITIDENMVIREAEARTVARPYPGSCETITPHYGHLKGLRIAPGFTKAVKERFAGVRGCTHLTEMIGTLATVAFQTRYGSAESGSDQKPPHLDGCHALDTHGPVVAKFYPKWFSQKS
jgi:hypothetical protein